MNFRLALFTPSLVDRQHQGFLEIENRAFTFWKNRWQKIYDEIGAPQAFKLDDFYRQQMVGTILDGEEPVALWAHSHFNIDSLACRSHSYFNFYNEPFIQWLKRQQVREVMSLEFFTVAEKETKREKSAPSFARTMAGLAQKIFLESEAHALVAPARVDVGVAHLAYEIGYECVQASTQQRGFECDLIACRRQNARQTLHQPSRLLIEELWANRMSLNRETQAANKSSIPNQLAG